MYEDETTRAKTRDEEGCWPKRLPRLIMATAKKIAAPAPKTKGAKPAPKASVKKTPAPKPVPKAKEPSKPAPKAKAAKPVPEAPKMKSSPLLKHAARPTLIDQLVSSSSGPQLPVRLQAVVDKSEIAELLASLARGLDRIDETLLRSVFHPDATIDLGPGVFQGTAADYVHWAIGVLTQTRESHHLIGNILPTLEGDVAFVESYCQAHFRMDKPTGREDVFIGSRFLDRMERRPATASGVWKIMHRKQVIDWVRTEAVSDLFYHQNPDALWSYRTKTDLSYQMSQFPGNQSGTKMPSFLGRRYESKSIKF